MNNYFIILAAGSGRRFKDKVPKQYIIYKNKPLYLHSFEKALESKLFKEIILVINKKHKKFIKKKIKIIYGGRTRQISSLKALMYLKRKKVNNVFIHDAARPNISIKLLKRLNFYTKKNKAVVPYINSTNSIKIKNNNKIIKPYIIYQKIIMNKLLMRLVYSLKTIEKLNLLKVMKIILK